ncbi:hypothetical protein ACFV24_12370 [Nocardia fluminea]|uniref:hypothetical protein n=1 Tax=Nocardia fluminea TaxID=134984 RepID=UPI00366E1BB9
MNTKILTIALPVIAALALGVGLTAAAPAEAVSDSPCEFRFHLGGAYLKDGAVLGGGYVDCKTSGSTPVQFKTLLELRHKDKGSGWATRTVAQSEQIPAPVLNIATWAPCEPGGWEIRVTMWDTRRYTPEGAEKTEKYSDTSASMITNC